MSNSRKQLSLAFWWLTRNSLEFLSEWCFQQLIKTFSKSFLRGCTSQSFSCNAMVYAIYLNINSELVNVIDSSHRMCGSRISIPRLNGVIYTTYCVVSHVLVRMGVRRNFQGATVSFSRWWSKTFLPRGLTMVEFSVCQLRITKKHFSPNKWVGKYQTSKFTRAKAPPAPPSAVDAGVVQR